MIFTNKLIKINSLINKSITNDDLSDTLETVEDEKLNYTQFIHNTCNINRATNAIWNPIMFIPDAAE